MTNTKKLQGKMREKNQTIITLSAKVDLSPTGLFNKIHNKCEFLTSEMFKISEILGLENAEMREIFFANPAEYNSTSDGMQNDESEG